MRNKWLYSVCFGMILILFASCGKEKDIRTVIPSDAMAVYALDLPALAMKGGLENEDVQQLMLTWMEKAGGQDREYMAELMKDPSDTGIDYDQKMYLFMTAKNDIVLVSKLESKRQFKKLLAHVGDGWMAVDEWLTEDDFDYLESDNMAIVLDNDMAMLTYSLSGATAEAMRLRAMGWLQQKKEESFKSTQDCKALEEAGGDMAAWMTMQAVPKQIYQLVSQGSLPRDVRIEDIHCMINCYFEKGKLRLKASVLPSGKAATQYYEEQAALMKPIEGKFLPDSGYTPWIWMGLGIDGKKYYQLLEQNVEMRQLLEEAAFGFNIKRFVSAVDGDMAFTLDMPETQETALLPAFAVQADLKNDSILEDMVKMQQLMSFFGIDMKRDGPRMYSWIQPDFKIWLGVDENNRFYCGNTENLLHPMGKHPEWISELDGCLFYLRMDIRQQVEKKREVLESDPYVRLSLPVLKLFDALVMQSKDAKECNMELRTVDGRENVLKQVLATLAEVYGTN